MHHSGYQRNSEGQGPPGKQVPEIRAGTNAAHPCERFQRDITGEYPENIDSIIPDVDPDLVLVRDISTIRAAPGFASPTAYVIADAYSRDGKALSVAPRMILKKVLALYAKRGWRPVVVAPEVEALSSPRTRMQFPARPAHRALGPHRNGPANHSGLRRWANLKTSSSIFTISAKKRNSTSTR